MRRRIRDSLDTYKGPLLKYKEGREIAEYVKHDVRGIPYNHFEISQTLFKVAQENPGKRLQLVVHDENGYHSFKSSTPEAYNSSDGYTMGSDDIIAGSADSIDTFSVHILSNPVRGGDDPHNDCLYWIVLNLWRSHSKFYGPEHIKNHTGASKR